MSVLYILVQVDAVQNVQKLWVILGPVTIVLEKQVRCQGSREKKPKNPQNSLYFKKRN